MKRKLLFFGLVLGLQFHCFGQEPIDRSEFLPIGGIEHYVSIKATDASKPVILFLHGGPGSPFSPFADAIFDGWEKDFILVQWDQRGAGKTYGIYAPEELDPEFLKAHPLSVEQMVKDGIELSEFLKKDLGKEKIILFGTSWGSVLGAKMAAERPDLFHAYIGHSQLVDPSGNNKETYQKMLRLVHENNDEESLQLLNTIGAPPYDEARKMGQFIRLIKKYEGMKSDPFLAAWAEIPSEYSSARDIQNRADADDYSFLSYAGDKRFGVEPIAGSIDLLQDTFRFEIAVYLIQGEEDIMTPKEVTAEYLEKIEAPEKELILVPKAAHGFTAAVVDIIYKVLKEEVLPNIEE